MAAGVPARSQKSERLEARLTPRQKVLLQRAADLAGTSLTEFVVQSAQRAAERAIQSHELLALTARESAAFVGSLLEPPDPNVALRAAAQRHQKLTATTDSARREPAA